MVDFGISVISGDPQGGVFLQAVQDFAINNAVVEIILVLTSYGATVLMNFSAYNQVITRKQTYYKN